MKEQFGFVVVLVIFFSQGCFTCFLDNSINNRSVTTGSSFYEECCCTEAGSNLKQLQWYDPYNRIIDPLGPGTDVYIEEQGECLSLVIKSSSKTLAGAYRCVTTVDGVQHSQIHHLDVYDQLYFFNTPKNQYLIHNNNSLITCEATGATPPFIRWYIGKDGQNELSNDTVKYQFMPQGLLVKNVNDDDGGIYRCTASVLSTGEEVDIDIDVRVMTPPLITELTASPEAIVTAKDPLMIMCSAEGLPDPVFKWKKIPAANPGEERNVSWKVQLNNTIRFDSIQPEDAGTYECIAHNFVGISKKQINIVVLTPPEIIGFNNITALAGTEIPIYCNVSGIPLPNVTITYEGKSLEEERETEYDEIIQNFSLLKVDRKKEGIYLCNATNYVDSTSQFMYLSVLRPPYFEKTFESLWGWSGETVNISCDPESNPPSNITWRFVKGNFSTIEKQEHDNIVLDYETASEHSLPFSDQFAPFGIHECNAQNEYGAAAKVYHIRKGFPPSAIVNVTIIDETATSAIFDIEPPNSYEGPDVIGFIAEYDEAANYEITNIHPNRTWAIGVPFKLEKLRPNTTYRIRFAAINRVGTGEWGDEGIEFETMDKSAPEPPIWQVDPLQISSNKVLKWKAPENNGEPIDYYALRYCPVNDDLDESLCKEHRLAPTTELEVSDLEHNTTYYLELIAHNSEGNSTPANISLTIPAEVPSEPAPLLSGAALIGISVVVVLLCLLLLDLLLLFWRKQGIIASCCYKKSKKRKPNPLNSRDKKGLLKDNGESSTDDTLRRPNNGHKEYEYNKTTGIITGKHSSV